MKKLLLTLLGGVLCSLNLWAATTIGLTSALSDTPTKTIAAPVYSNGSVEGITVTSAIGTQCAYNATSKNKTWNGYATGGWCFNKKVKTSGFTGDALDQWVGYKISLAANKKMSLSNINAKMGIVDDTNITYKVLITDADGETLYESTTASGGQNEGPEITVASPTNVTNLTSGDYYVKMIMWQNGTSKYFVVPYLTVDVTVEDDFNTNSPVIDTDINSSYNVDLGSSLDLSVEASNYSSLTWYESTTSTPNPASDTQLGTGKTLKYTPSAVGTTYVYCYAYNDHAAGTNSVCSTVATVTTTFVNVTSVSTTPVLNMLQYAGATLTATVAPANASNKNVTWSTSDANTVTVNATTGVLYAKAVGTANITVTTEDGSKTATCVVTVSEISGEVIFSAVPVEGKTLNLAKGATSDYLTADYATIVGGKVSLKNGHASNAADVIVNNTFNVAASGGSYVHLNFDNALKEGDVIVLKDYYGNGVSKADAFYVSTTDVKGSNQYSFPYVVTYESPLKDATDIYLWKSTENAVKTIEVYGDVPFDDGSRTLSWNLQVNEAESTITTSSKTSSKSNISNLSNLDASKVTVASSSKPTATNKISSTQDKAAEKYISFTFDVADGYGFVPTSVNLGITAVSEAKTIEVEMSSTSATENVTQQVAKNDAPAATIFDFAEKVYTGTVTVKIYGYGGTSGYRLGQTISIDGYVGTKGSLNASGYASFSNAEDVKVLGVDVNKASVDGTTITLTKVDGGEVPANNGVLLSGNSNQNYIFCPVENAANIDGNDLLSTNNASVGSYDWVLSGNQFKHYTGANFTANKSYLHFDTDPFAGSGAAFRIVFGEATNISNVNAASVAPVKRLVNGQVRIIKNGKMFNAAGALLK